MPSPTPTAPKTKSTRSKRSTTGCAIWAILAASALLTGCSHVSRESADSRRLYQPPVLRLEAGQLIATADGLHVPVVDEVWHSDARFRALADSYADALAALAAAQHRAK